MLEILIIIAVVKGFCSVAESKGQSKLLWGIIGAFSYYVPILLMSFVVLPYMMQAGMLPFVTRENAIFVAIGLNLGVGVICCLMAFLFLKAMPIKQQTQPMTSQSQFGGLPNAEPHDQDSNPYRSPRT